MEFELIGFSLNRGDIGPAFALLADRFQMRWSLGFSDDRTRMAILVSKYGHCLYDLLVRWRLGELSTSTPLVISNHKDLEPVIRDFGVPYRCPIY